MKAPCRRRARPERARFHSAMLDVRSLRRREGFAKLLETWVIFITERDVLKGGLPLYTIERRVSETGEFFGDGAHIVYVNGSLQDMGTDLGRLMHDFQCSDPEEMSNGQLAELVRFHQGRTTEGGKRMSRTMNAIRREAKAEGEAKGRAEGKAEERESFATRMIEAGKLALEEIAEYSGLTLARVQKLAQKTA